MELDGLGGAGGGGGVWVGVYGLGLGFVWLDYMEILPTQVPIKLGRADLGN